MSTPMPMLSEKKACPKALITTESVIFEKSGLNKKASPSMPPGRVMERTANTMRITTKSGIRIFEYFSMPSATPLNTTNAVKNIKTHCHKMFFHPMLWKSTNSCSMTSRSLPANWLPTALTMYSNVQPATVE